MVAVNNIRNEGKTTDVGGDLDAAAANFLGHGSQFWRIDQGYMPLPPQFEGEISDHDLGTGINV